MAAWRAPTTVLDTGWGDGSGFLNFKADWLNAHPANEVLHYVGMVEQLPAGAWPPGRMDTLGPPTPGFQRVSLDGGRVVLTLCIGPLQAMLKEQTMQADMVFFQVRAAAWDKWSIKAMAKCCAVGARVNIDPASPLPPALANAFTESGFQPQVPNDGTVPGYAFAPRWHVRKRPGVARAAVPAQHCAVIGGGLAGASVAHALAQRGWHIDVFDELAHCAAGASGLPVGLVVPHVSADDGPRSRLSRSGVRLMLAHAARLTSEGEDWALSGVMEHRDAPWGPLQHTQAGWIKPARLVQAWLSHPGIRFHANTKVGSVQPADQGWVLNSADGRALTRVPHVVFANAYGCRALLEPLGFSVALQQVHGTLSHGRQPLSRDLAPDRPVNGNGSFVHGIPTADGLQWFAGATFEMDALCLADTPAQHHANHQRMGQLLPGVANALAAVFASGEVSAWKGTRCVTRDRLPLVGPLQAGDDNTLWISAGMGSRGLSFSALCADVLAAHMCAEPLPVEASLVRCLHAQRALNPTQTRMRLGGPPP